MKKQLVIIGAGGHAKVIADAVLKGNEFELLGFVDANLAKDKTIYKDYKVIEQQESIRNLIQPNTYFVFGIGNNAIRENLAKEFRKELQFATIIHPNATIACDVEVGLGSVILSNSVINADTKIGEFTIIDSGVLIDHECRIGDFCHINVGSIIGSNSECKTGLKTDLGEIVPNFTKR